MPYFTRDLITDQREMPIPQVFNPVADNYEVLLGANGASRVMLWDANGNPLLTAGNPGVMKVSDGIETLAINPDGSALASLTDGVNPISQANPLPVGVNASKLSAVTNMQTAAAAVGAGTQLPTSGYGVAVLSISGPFVGTVTFEGQGPDGNWYPVNAMQRGTGALSTTATAAGLFEINTRGLTAVRANITAYTSGAITVKGHAQPLTTGGEFLQLSGSNMELYGKSTDIKPTTNLKVGTSFFEIDTTDAYMWDGSSWRLI